MNRYRIDNNRIILKNGSIAEFNFPIEKVVELGNLVFVVLQVLKTKYNENVFSLNENGQVLWQIEKSKTINEISGECPYIDIEIRNGKLTLFNFCGFRFIVDPQTGKIVDETFTK
jgi:hypothetical protein